jgi:hypothetical protein
VRDEFPKATIEILAKRVGQRCSNPSCMKRTSGPHTEPTKSVIIGVAAHMTAASSGGPRYDPNLSPNDRRSPLNGIWLCQTCSKLIDSDEAKFSVELLCLGGITDRITDTHTQRGLQDYRHPHSAGARDTQGFQAPTLGGGSRHPGFQAPTLFHGFRMPTLPKLQGVPGTHTFPWVPDAHTPQAPVDWRQSKFPSPNGGCLATQSRKLIVSGWSMAFQTCEDMN